MRWPVRDHHFHFPGEETETHKLFDMCVFSKVPVSFELQPRIFDSLCGRLIVLKTPNFFNPSLISTIIAVWLYSSSLIKEDKSIYPPLESELAYNFLWPREGGVLVPAWPQKTLSISCSSHHQEHMPGLDCGRITNTRSGVVLPYLS